MLHGYLCELCDFSVTFISLYLTIICVQVSYDDRGYFCSYKKFDIQDFYTFCLPEILVAHIAEIRQSFKMILNMPPYTARTAFII